MSITRRALLTGAAQLAAAAGAVALNEGRPEAAALQTPGGTLPARRDFAIPPGQTYLNSAIIAFTARDAEKRFGARLKRADVSVTLSGERIRISPSLFNDARDIDVLLSTLS